MLATETEAYIINMAKEPPSPSFAMMRKSTQKTNIEPSWNNTSVFLGNEVQVFLESLRAHGNSTGEYMGLPTGFTKKMQQTELHPRQLISVEVLVNSLLLNITDTKNAGMKLH